MLMVPSVLSVVLVRDRLPTEADEKVPFTPKLPITTSSPAAGTRLRSQLSAQSQSVLATQPLSKVMVWASAGLAESATSRVAMRNSRVMTVRGSDTQPAAGALSNP